jgi:hypothetical protein
MTTMHGKLKAKDGAYRFKTVLGVLAYALNPTAIMPAASLQAFFRRQLANKLWIVVAE